MKRFKENSKGFKMVGVNLKLCQELIMELQFKNIYESITDPKYIGKVQSNLVKKYLKQDVCFNGRKPMLVCIIEENFGPQCECEQR